MDAQRRLTRLLGRPGSRILTVVAAVALVAATPACAQEEGGGQEEGQQQQPQQQSQQFQEVQQLQQEIQGIQNRLSQIQQQAIQDSAIQADYTVLQENVRAGMAQLDPEAIRKEDSLTALQQEMSRAQQNQDTARMQALMSEGRALSMELGQLRDSVMQRDSVQERLESLRQDLEEEMTSINDSVPMLMERRDSLMQRLQELARELRGQQGGQGGVIGGGTGQGGGGGQGSGGGGPGGGQ